MADLRSLRCSRCDQRGHIAEHCPHYLAERIEHQDGWTPFDNAPSREADDGNNCILRDAVELHQTGDGHYFFRFLAGGLRCFASVATPLAVSFALAALCLAVLFGLFISVAFCTPTLSKKHLGFILTAWVAKALAAAPSALKVIAVIGDLLATCTLWRGPSHGGGALVSSCVGGLARPTAQRQVA